ncbi:MAG: N-acetylmuramoyl-L-alanine amidase [Alphaproteobacteria bacterium]|nr:N-acetylmuramoyl-L-alanine amidase [Alphaproteobacteria bacterium]
MLTASLLLLSALSARAGELEQIRVFVGEQHSQVLLVADAPMQSGAPRVLPRDGALPARAAVTFAGVSIDERLEGAYPRQGEHQRIEVDQGGVRRVLFKPVRTDAGPGVELVVELDQPRAATVTPVGQAGLLLELRVPGAPDDPTLPDPALLARWMEGVSLSRQAPTSPRRVIVVDPGHGGEDHGAVGLSGAHEADVALALSRRVARELEERLDVEVVLTRQDDTFIPLRDRAAMANALDAVVFVSIHANAAPGPTAWGIETYYVDTASDAGAARVAARENAMVTESEGELDRIVAQLAVAGTNQLSRDLAARVQREVVTQLQGVFGPPQIRDLGVKTALFYVLVSTRMPAILFEAGFLTQTEDELRVRHPIYQQVAAEAIADAVEAWLVAQEGGR